MPPQQGGIIDPERRYIDSSIHCRHAARMNIAKNTTLYFVISFR